MEERFSDHAYGDFYIMLWVKPDCGLLYPRVLPPELYANFAKTSFHISPAIRFRSRKFLAEVSVGVFCRRLLSKQLAVGIPTVDERRVGVLSDRRLGQSGPKRSPASSSSKVRTGSFPHPRDRHRLSFQISETAGQANR